MRQNTFCRRCRCDLILGFCLEIDCKFSVLNFFCRGGKQFKRDGNSFGKNPNQHDRREQHGARQKNIAPGGRYRAFKNNIVFYACNNCAAANRELLKCAKIPSAVAVGVQRLQILLSAFAEYLHHGVGSKIHARAHKFVVGMYQNIALVVDQIRGVHALTKIIVKRVGGKKHCRRPGRVFLNARAQKSENGRVKHRRRVQDDCFAVKAAFNGITILGKKIIRK